VYQRGDSLLDYNFTMRSQDPIERNPLSSLDVLTNSSGIANQGMPSGGNPLGSDLLVNKIRKISPVPFRVIDAPNLCDDFYLNLVDWSIQNALAVALGQTVFIWNANNQNVTKLVDLGERNRVTSVSWSQKGAHLSVGTLDGQV
jgi:WD40 repeat protein